MNKTKEQKIADLWEEPIDSTKIPEIELYMDQLLSLIGDKGITKTMINNYSKEHLIKPLKGKKYSKEQIIQMLCIVNLKKIMPLGSIKGLMKQEEGAVDFQKVYDMWAGENHRLSEAAAAFAEETAFSQKDEAAAEHEKMTREEMTHEEKALLAAMMLASCCGYFSSVCEELAREAEEESK